MRPPARIKSRSRPKNEEVGLAHQFRQKHLAEFTAEDEEAFIPVETVRGCMTILL